jgi:hypothetical protein
MTEHPLTDEKALSLFPFERLMNESLPITVEDSMRSAADWQLEQVIKWLKDNLACSTYLQSKGYYDCEIDVGDVLDDLKEAMRPQEDNNG